MPESFWELEWFGDVLCFRMCFSFLPVLLRERLLVLFYSLGAAVATLFLLVSVIESFLRSFSFLRDRTGS